MPLTRRILWRFLLPRTRPLLGNLFAEKVKGTAESPGFSQGSFSELRIAQSADWTPKDILQRGVELLEFIEQRWSIPKASRPTKVSLLKLEFIEPDPAFDALTGLISQP